MKKKSGSRVGDVEIIGKGQPIKNGMALRRTVNLPHGVLGSKVSRSPPRSNMQCPVINGGPTSKSILREVGRVKP